MEEINISTKNGNLFETNQENSFFDVVITKEDDIFCSLCIELNVASEGETLVEARKNLLEAVKDYIELSLEHETPLVRWVPFEDNPLLNSNENIIETFKIKVPMNLFEYA